MALSKSTAIFGNVAATKISAHLRRTGSPIRRYDDEWACSERSGLITWDDVCGWSSDRGPIGVVINGMSEDWDQAAVSVGRVNEGDLQGVRMKEDGQAHVVEQ